jgi:hypothetical protein
MWTRTTAASILICALIAAIALVSFLGTSSPAQKLGPDWSRLTIVTYPSGLTGFFDPSTGKLYVYDADLERCLMIRQLDRLGESLKSVQD